MKTSFDFVLTSEQFAQAVKRNNQKLMRKLPARRLIQLCATALWGALAFMLFYALSVMDSHNAGIIKPLFIAAMVTVASFALYSVLYFQGLSRLMRQINHLVDVSRRLSIEDNGVRITGPRGEAFTPWAGIMEIEEAADVVTLTLDHLHSTYIPTSAFESSAEKDAFIAYVRARIADGVAGAAAIDSSGPAPAPAADTPAPPLPPSPAATQKRVVATLRTSLGQAFKLAFFMRVPEERIGITWWQVPVFAFLSLVISVIWGLFQVGLSGEFQWYSLPSVLFHVPVLLLAGIATAYALGLSWKSPLLVQAFLMIAVVIDLALALMDGLFSSLAMQVPGGRIVGPALFYLPALWMATACAMAALRLLSAKAARGMLAFGVCAVLVALPLSLVYRDRNIWRQPFDPDAYDRYSRMTPASEDAFYEQPAILARELAAVQPGRKGLIDIYFIGMAGYAQQDVFMKEVESVAQLFRERFGAQNRTIRLVNNAKSIAKLPIASNTSLRASLKRVAESMNRDEDVLFLFLTSHGSEKHRFSLEFWPMQFNALDPVRLRALLDESGIKHRVIVISACYSGGFLNAIQDENTLVISASAPDKNSFGCSSEADWTYFGKAYFDEALRNTFSFTDAFHIARPLIAEREKTQGFNPSEPQIAEGASIHAKLAKLEQQLRADGRKPYLRQ